MNSKGAGQELGTHGWKEGVTSSLVEMQKESAQVESLLDFQVVHFCRNLQTPSVLLIISYEGEKDEDQIS